MASAFAFRSMDAHDQKVTRAGRCDICDADSLGSVALRFEIARLAKLDRNHPADRLQPNRTSCIDVSARNCASGPVRGIRKKHDGEFQPLSLVHSHDPHAFRSLLHDRSLASSSSVSLRFNALDKGTERRRATLEAARHVNKPLTICQRLLAVLPERHPGMGPHAVQQCGDRFGDRTVVAPAVEPAQEVKRVGDLQACRIERFAIDGQYRI
jgi:hypothetical protein